MATEKLADGIRKFAADIEKLEKMIEAKLKEHPTIWYSNFKK